MSKQHSQKNEQSCACWREAALSGESRNRKRAERKCFESITGWVCFVLDALDLFLSCLWSVENVHRSVRHVQNAVGQAGWFLTLSAFLPSFSLISATNEFCDFVFQLWLHLLVVILSIAEVICVYWPLITGCFDKIMKQSSVLMIANWILMITSPLLFLILVLFFSAYKCGKKEEKKESKTGAAAAGTGSAASAAPPVPETTGACEKCWDIFLMAACFLGILVGF